MGEQNSTENACSQHCNRIFAAFKVSALCNQVFKFRKFIVGRNCAFFLNLLYIFYILPCFQQLLHFMNYCNVMKQMLLILFKLSFY